MRSSMRVCSFTFPRVCLGFQCVAAVPEPYCLFEEACEDLTEALPLLEAVVFVAFEGLGEQMGIATLFGQGPKAR